MRVKKKLSQNKEGVIVYVVFLIMLIVFSIFQKDFGTKWGAQSMFNQIITLVVASMAQTLVILIGGIDLSIGSMVGLSNSIIATYFAVSMGLFHDHVLPASILIILVTLAAGALMGLINGFFIVKVGLQSIVVTIATSSIYLGIAMYVRPTSGGAVPSVFCRALTGFAFSVIPVSAIIIALFIVIWLLFRRTRLCQNIYAVGGNETSAYLCGIPVERTKMSAYVLSGLICAATGILLTAQTASGDPLSTSGFTINSIAATVMGGVSLSGGKGSYLGSVAGASIFSLILALLIFWSVSSFYQSAVRGLVLLIILAVIAVIQMRRKAK